MCAQTVGPRPYGLRINNDPFNPFLDVIGYLASSLYLIVQAHFTLFFSFKAQVNHC